MLVRAAALIGLVVAGPLRAQGQALAQYPPPGRLVDIGGRKLHLLCSGRGRPTVILVAGGDAYAIDWTLVEPAVARATRVCSYDRAGLGWSDPGPAEETVEETIGDLHRLLQAAGETGPYVLVGASIGGVFIRAYQHAYPNEVAGLLFSNSSHRVGMAVHGRSDLLWNLPEEEVRSIFPLPSSARGAEPAEEGEPFDRLPADVRAARLWLDRRLWERRDPAHAGPESMLSWRREFQRELQESCGGPPFPLGDLPVIVLSSDSSASELSHEHRLGRRFCDRSDASDGLELLSSNSAYIVATGSGHEIHLYLPETVAQGLERLVRAVRDHVPVSRVPERP